MPKTLTVYGASDDLVEVDGAIVEEFPTTGNQDQMLLAFSFGIVLRIRYADEGADGVWRIETVASHPGVTLDIVQAPEDDESNYSDRATITVPDSVITGPLWVVSGTTIAKETTRA